VIRYAVALPDLDAIWNTRAGAALVEAAVLDQEAEDAEVIHAEGSDALVLQGSEPEVAALVSGLSRARLPGSTGRHVRVYAEGTSGWQPVSTPPRVPDLPDETPALEGEETAS
jgi:hypothetical protein